MCERSTVFAINQHGPRCGHTNLDMTNDGNGEVLDRKGFVFFFFFVSHHHLLIIQKLILQVAERCASPVLIDGRQDALFAFIEGV